MTDKPLNTTTIHAHMKEAGVSMSAPEWAEAFEVRYFLMYRALCVLRALDLVVLDRRQWRAV